MIKHIILALFITLSFWTYSADLKSGFVETLIAEKLNPTSMDIAPDGRIFIAEKNGRILIVEQDILLETPFLEIEVDDYNERGVNGILLDPEFDQNGYIYIYYTVKDLAINRVSRFTANGNTALPNSEKVLFEMDPVNGSGVHNGGGMVCDNEDYLYICTGDGGNANNAQDLTNTLGKVIRIEKNGEIPESNPFYNQLDGNNRAIYAYGLRNPFTVAYSNIDDLFYINDVGGSDYEEINKITAGKNYGWPIIEGYASTSDTPENYEDPVYSYDHSLGCAIVGASFYTPELYIFPEKYHNTYLFADYCQGTLNIFNPTNQEVIDTIATGLNSLVYTKFNTEGDLFYLQRQVASGSIDDNTSTKNGTLWKISYSGTGVPYIASHPKDQTVTQDDTAYFSIISSGEDPLNYEWYINNQLVEDNNYNSLSIAKPSLDLDQAIIYCEVSNNEGSIISNSAILTVTTNKRPSPQIISPNSDYLYTCGTLLSFSGEAFDEEDGDIPAENFTWHIDFHHDLHTHPAMDPVTGIKTGSFEIPKIGETDTNVWYRIYLTVEDSEGLSKTVFKDIYPVIKEIRIESDDLENAYIWHDGKKVFLPYTYYSVPGLIRSLEVPNIIKYSDSTFIFESWSSGEREKLIYKETPSENSTIKINFNKTYRFKGNGLLGNYYLNENDFLQNQYAIERIDETVNFDWTNVPPFENFPMDRYYVRWTGYIKPYISGNYTLFVASDDGVNLWIDDELVIEDWTNHGLTEFSSDVYLEKDEYHKIRLEYYEDQWGSQVYLLWEMQNIDKEIIPQENLYTEKVEVGISSFEERGKLDLYPNPFDNTLTFNLSDQHRGKITVQIFNDVGQLVKENNINSQNNSLNNLDDLPAGNYIIQVSSNTKNETLQAVKLP